VQVVQGVRPDRAFVFAIHLLFSFRTARSKARRAAARDAEKPSTPDAVCHRHDPSSAAHTWM
jgi:hypothetical protein